MKNIFPNGTVCVAISPDFGDKYLDTIYNEEWLRVNLSPKPLSVIYSIQYENRRIES